MTNRSNSYNNTSDTRPYWQDKPCPTWCEGPHGANDSIIDAQHMSDGQDMLLTTEECAFASYPGSNGEKFNTTRPTVLTSYLDQHHLEGNPRVAVSIDGGTGRGGKEADGRTLHLTLAEARTLARTLAELVDLADSTGPAE